MSREFVPLTLVWKREVQLVLSVTHGEVVEERKQQVDLGVTPRGREDLFPFTVRLLVVSIVRGEGRGLVGPESG